MPFLNIHYVLANMHLCDFLFLLEILTKSIFSLNLCIKSNTIYHEEWVNKLLECLEYVIWRWITKHKISLILFNYNRYYLIFSLKKFDLSLPLNIANILLMKHVNFYTDFFTVYFTRFLWFLRLWISFTQIKLPCKEIKTQFKIY